MIETVQVYIMGSCKMGCRDCHLINGYRDVAQGIENFKKVFTSWYPHLGDLTEVEFESAGVLTSGRKFIEEYFEDLVDFIDSHGNKVAGFATFDYYKDILTTGPIINDILKKYNGKYAFRILSPVPFKMKDVKFKRVLDPSNPKPGKEVIILDGLENLQIKEAILVNKVQDYTDRQPSVHNIDSCDIFSIDQREKNFATTSNINWNYTKGLIEEFWNTTNGSERNIALQISDSKEDFLSATLTQFIPFKYAFSSPVPLNGYNSYDKIVEQLYQKSMYLSKRYYNRRFNGKNS